MVVATSGTCPTSRESVWSRLQETARAFDGVAAEYDTANTSNPILARMRSRTVAMLRRHVPAGSDLLDLGCGPGTDHETLAESGYRVTGIDASPEMIQQARRHVAAGSRVRGAVVLCRPIEQLDKFRPASFDAAFSNFGPLNCVADLASVARKLHTVLRPGGVLVASVIGRVCPWEIAFHAVRGDVRRALVRLRRGVVGVPLKDGTVWTRYLTPRAFTETWRAAGFVRRDLVGLGVVAPPPYLSHLAARYPSFVRRTLDLDEFVAGWPIVRNFGDHFLIVLRRD